VPVFIAVFYGRPKAHTLQVRKKPEPHGHRRIEIEARDAASARSAVGVNWDATDLRITLKETPP
jgi:hypothetical protein